MEKVYRPSMFKMAPFRFLLSVLLIFVFGIGLLILLVWFLKCKSVSLRVDDERSILTKGILSKSTTEIWHKDVRQVKISQSFGQRLTGVSMVSISSAAGDGDEIVIAGIPDAAKLKEVIDTARRAA